MQIIKRRFFALRNGVISDALRKGGSPYRIIFGLNLPQIVEISSETPHRADLAETLWANKTTRESLLLAPMIYPPEEFSYDKALLWLRESPDVETVDILCHRLIRKLPFAKDLAKEVGESSDDLMRYSALRIMFNLVYNDAKSAKEIAERFLEDSSTRVSQLARMLKEEAEFILE